MRQVDRKFEQLVLVCVNERIDGRECCAHKKSSELYEKLKAAVKEWQKGQIGQISIRVSRTYCLDHCETGATVAIMPQNVYLGEVTEADIPEIIDIIKARP